jgi:hypothetical protein
MHSATYRLIAGWVTEFARPAAARKASSTGSDGASANAARHAAVTNTQRRIAVTAPM